MAAPTALVPAPRADTVNGGKSACKTSELVRRYGIPVDRLTDDCQPVQSPIWTARFVKIDLGIPYHLGKTRYSGSVWVHRSLAKRLIPALAAVKAKRPDLHALLGHAGTLCVRRVRGGTSPSNHSFGLAIDFTIDGVLDAYGDGKVQQGLVDLYAILKKFGFYWGLEFGARNPRREDGMHFEVCWEEVNRDIAAGTF